MNNAAILTTPISRRKKASLLIILGIYLIFDLAAVLAFGSPVKAAVPKTDVKRLIILEAEKSPNVSASLALAVAYVESRFKSDAVSPKGAIGVMQIMPRTGREVFGITAQKLYDPQTNISAGITFLSQLIEQYDGRIDHALSHYNGGSAVSKNGQNRIIPYTRGYVLKVLAAAQKYAAESNDLEAKIRPEDLSKEPYLKAKSYRNVQEGPKSGFTKLIIGEHSLSSDLKQVDFWLQAASANRKGNMNHNMSSPSARLIAQMTNNRLHFRNRLRQHQ